MITLNLLWHQHQPDYRHPSDGVPVLPWVRLHAVKGYLDLLSILKRYEHARCCVNFSGILLEQLCAATTGKALDRYAELTLKPAGALSQEERVAVLRSFFSAHTTNLIRTHLRYQELLEKRESLVRLEGYAAAAERFTEQEFTDLLVWFNLAWIGFTGQKRADVRSLIARGRDYAHHDQLLLQQIHQDLLGQVLAGYKELAQENRIELSFTPYHHPILPLICDLSAEGHHAALDPLPDFRYPQDALEQIQRGAAWYLQCFGSMPCGAWPAEGSVSDAALGVFAGTGLSWVATDQQNLPPEKSYPLAHLSPWRWSQGGHQLHVFFRDTRLSDNVGFEYSDWPPAVAGAHLVNMALAMAQQSREQHPIVTIALDGENPWESYPDGGEAFLCALFEGIAQDSRVQCNYPRSILAERSCGEISSVSAGSWIFGNFDIWSRHSETRTAWRRLARARAELMDVAQGQVLEHLMAAEGSDWFWWYGDDFVSEESALFDELFRAHLIAAYEAAGREVPDEMYVTIITERAPAALGAISALIEPRLDGRITTFYEWHGAVRIGAAAGQSSMARSANGGIIELWYGFSITALYLRLHVTEDVLATLQADGMRLAVTIAQNGTDCLRSFDLPPGARTDASADLALDQIIELRLGLDDCQIQPGKLSYLRIEVSSGDSILGRFPAAGRLPLLIPSQDFAAGNWSV